MSLQLKLALLFVALSVITFTARDKIIDATLIRKFDALERQSVIDDIARIEHAHKLELDGKRTMLKDWAQWDETYRFAGGENNPARYIEENMMDATFISSGLNLIATADTEGKILYAKAFDTDRNKELPVPEELVALAASGSILAPGEKSGRDGVVTLGGRPALIFTWSILTSEAEGPMRGTLIMARFVDESLARAYSGIVGLPIRLLFPGDPDLPGEMIGAGRADPASFPSHTELLDFDRTRCVMMFPDVNGYPAFYLEFVRPSAIKIQGRRSLAAFRLYTMIGAIILIVILLEIIRRQVTTRIRRLSKSFGALAREADFTARVRQEGRDEIGLLSLNINRTLEALEDKHKQASDEALRRKAAEESVAGQRDSLDAINKFLIESMICDDAKKLALFFVNEMRKLTRSEFGFAVLDNPEIGFDIAVSGLSEDGSDRFEMILYRSALDDFEYGEVVRLARDGRDIVAKNEPFDPSGEFEEDGIARRVSSYVCIPSLNERQSVRAVFFADKPGGYEAEDIATIDRLFMVFVGVLMRKRAEIRMVESESRYRTLVSNLSDAILTLDLPEWKFSTCNQSALKIFGAVSENDLLGMSPVNLSPPKAEGWLGVGQQSEQNG